MSTDLLVVTALRSEYAALRGTVRSLARCGMGAARVQEWLPTLGAHAPRAVAIAGVAGGLDPAVRPGDVVVADEVRDAGGRVPLRAAAPLAAQLRAMGLRVHVGPVVTSDHVVDSVEERARLATCNALAVDMESAPIARAARELPDAPMVAVVRVVVDTTHHRLVRPSTVTNGVRALATLRRLGPELEKWAELAGPRTVLLAGPRSFCAGVERAIDIVEKTLERHAHPVYVRRQIVHNAHVVRDLERRGAAFVHELDEVPDGATVVFSAHGVAPAVREEADRRDLRVIDATCPLVAKVHAEARRFAKRGDTVLFVGHAGHDETEGTLGEVPGRIALVSGPEDAAHVEVENPERVSYLLQTTLAVDDAAATVDALRRRFPALDGPATDDICYATTNRQRAVTAVAEDAEVVLVIGSANSSNSLRLVEVVRRQGRAAHLVEDVTAVRPEWLRGVRKVGVTAGASAPPHLVDQLVETLRALGPVEIEERVVAQETITFTLPKEVSR